MNQVILRLKSGREFKFECESYKYGINQLDGSLTSISFEGAVGEVPVYFSVDNVEAIAVVKGQSGETHPGDSDEFCPNCGALMAGVRKEDIE